MNELNALKERVEYLGLLLVAIKENPFFKTEILTIIQTEDFIFEKCIPVQKKWLDLEGLNSIICTVDMVCNPENRCVHEEHFSYEIIKEYRVSIAYAQIETTINDIKRFLKSLGFKIIKVKTKNSWSLCVSSKTDIRGERK